MTHLLPCPFCGEKPELISTKIVICVMCQNADCPASHVEMEADSDDAAITAWNESLEGCQRSAVVDECAKIAREASENYDARATELFRKEGEWRLRAKALAAEEVEERILALKGPSL